MIEISFALFLFFHITVTDMRATCKVRTSVKFMSIPQIVLNNDILAEGIQKVAVAFFSNKERKCYTNRIYTYIE